MIGLVGQSRWKHPIQSSRKRQPESDSRHLDPTQKQRRDAGSTALEEIYECLYDISLFPTGAMQFASKTTDAEFDWCSLLFIKHFMHIIGNSIIGKTVISLDICKLDVHGVSQRQFEQLLPQPVRYDMLLLNPTRFWVSSLTLSK